MGRNLSMLVFILSLGISRPSIATDSPGGRVDFAPAPSLASHLSTPTPSRGISYSTFIELATLAMRCGQKVRREIRTQHNPSLRYIVDEYILELHDGSGLYFRFRDGGYHVFDYYVVPPNGIIDDEDSVNYSFWHSAGFGTFGAYRTFASPYFNERTMESVERLKRSVPPIFLNPNIC